MATPPPCTLQCFRLYQEKAFRQLRDAAVPEVQRVSLATVALRLLAMGVQRVQDFPFLQPPKRAAVARALEQLVVFRALDRRCVTCTSPVLCCPPSVVLCGCKQLAHVCLLELWGTPVGS